jgi:hypothetical protein
MRTRNKVFSDFTIRLPCNCTGPCTAPTYQYKKLVADPDQQYFGKPDPDPHQSKKLDLDHYSKNSWDVKAQKWNNEEPWTLTMEWLQMRSRTVSGFTSK